MFVIAWVHPVAFLKLQAGRTEARPDQAGAMAGGAGISGCYRGPVYQAGRLRGGCVTGIDIGGPRKNLMISTYDTAYETKLCGSFVFEPR